MPIEYALRTCKPNLTSAGGTFRWPAYGPVSALDWNPTPECGGGLHGFPRGAGNGELANWSVDAVWIVFAYESTQSVNLGDKIKVPRAWVVFSGSRREATEYIQNIYPDSPVIGGTSTRGVSGIAVAGYRGTATAGDYGMATAGHSGTASTGFSGVATTGYRGKSSAGQCGMATAGHRGEATTGYGGVANTGRYGRSITGNIGRSITGHHGEASAGDHGMILIEWWDKRAGRARVKTGYIGEDGLLPGVLYRVQNGEFVAVDDKV